jgi:hypothetical protein
LLVHGMGFSPDHRTITYVEGLTQVLEAVVTGLAPKQPYVLALAEQPDGGCVRTPLAAFSTNPARGNRQRGRADPANRSGRGPKQRRYLVIMPAGEGSAPAQVQTPKQ